MLDNITILEEPIRTEYLKWAIAHPECDSIIDELPEQSTILVYAYAKDKSANKEIVKFRNSNYVGKRILVGMTIDGINRIA